MTVISLLALLWLRYVHRRTALVGKVALSVYVIDIILVCCMCVKAIGGQKLVATSYDSAQQLYEKYPSAAENVAALRKLGARVYHSVDAKTLTVSLVPKLKVGSCAAHDNEL